MEKAEIEARIKKTHKFSELYTNIRQAGEVKGTRKSYSPNEMIGLIESVRKGAELNTITRTYGLREKVRELRGEEEIHAAKSFDELYHAIERVGNVKGTQTTYSPSDLKDLVEAVRHGEDTRYITRSLGLREKVTELMEPLSKEWKVGFTDLLSAGYSRGGVFLQSPGDVPRSEGFKIHVTADSKYAKDVKDIVVPILQKEKILHKVVESAETLENVMTGTQRGKFITIYPESNYQAKEIAKKVDSALVGKGLHGPRIPNDNALPGGRSGLVYYRYGGFTKGTITGRQGEQVPDRRSGPAVPAWVKDIFKE